MRKAGLASGLKRWALTVVVIGLCASICPAQVRRGAAAADISELLKKHDEAMNQHDLEGVLALFAPGPKTVVLGTGPGERYQGKQEIKAAYTEFFKDFDKGTLSHSCYWKQSGGSGSTAWGAAMCKFTDSLGNREREYELNVSAALEKQGGKWYFVLIHFSNLTGASAASQ